MNNTSAVLLRVGIVILVRSAVRALLCLLCLLCRAVYDTPSIQADPAKWQDVLKKICW